jgi:hypothetical protein
MPAAKVSRRTAGEGLGHTARVYVPEESHRGIVPMNHSNKDGTSSAESEEGRLRIKESAGQSNTCPTQSGEAGVSQGLSGVRTSGSLGRYSSEIRTGCANERPSGSVRGAPGDWCPYRDRQPLAQCAAYRPSPKVGMGSVYPTALFRIPESNSDKYCRRGLYGVSRILSQVVFRCNRCHKLWASYVLDM